MLDLAIAATFVREMTEDQFAAPRGPRGARAGTAPARQDAPSPRRAGARRRGATGGTRIGRTLSRLAQVRG
jgi:hypothetical protein